MRFNSVRSSEVYSYLTEHNHNYHRIYGNYSTPHLYLCISEEDLTAILLKFNPYYYLMNADKDTFEGWKTERNEE